MTWVTWGMVVGMASLFIFEFLSKKAFKEWKGPSLYSPWLVLSFMTVGAASAVGITLSYSEKHAIGQPVAFDDLTNGSFIIKGQLESEKEYRTVLALLPMSGRRYEAYPGKIFFLEVTPKKGEVFVVGEIVRKEYGEFFHTSTTHPSVVGGGK